MIADAYSNFDPLDYEAMPDDDRGCAYYFKKFDDQIIRPVFIYKYQQVRQLPEIAFEDVIKETNANYEFEVFTTN